MEMLFEAINPFIRYCHSFEIKSGMPFINVKAYDYRLMYIISGEGFIELDGISYEAVRGCLFFWQPGVLYSLLADRNKPFTIIGVNFDFTYNRCDINYPVSPECQSVFNKNNIIETIDFIDMQSLNKPVYLKAMLSMEEQLTAIVNEYTTRKKLYNVRMRGAFISLLSDIARHVLTLSSGPVPDSTENKVDQVIEFIHKNYSSPITNCDVGQHFSFHPIYINRLMVKYTGTSLHQYLINYRISVALSLLQTTANPITEIAYSVGFRDINYFSKCFKKIVGLSPKNYIAAARSSQKQD